MNQQNNGKLSIESNNIFTILKKWLYTEPDIVFRELISNATDAIEKRNLLATDAVLIKGCIEVTLNPENRQLIISDNGIGMDFNEIQKYINNIAFSGAEDFIKNNNQSGKSSIIGHFGVGFYSAFMLANHVAIESKSYRHDAPAVRWDCTSDMSFEMNECEKETVGTTVILYLDEANVYLHKPALVYESIRKYFIFSGYDVFFTSPDHMRVLVNHTDAVWRKAEDTVSNDEMNAFYKDYFNETSDPLFQIPFASPDIGLRGILFFRNTRNGTEELDGQIDVYCRGIYVGTNLSELIPKFVNLQSGILECNNLPLVVSRSGIQNDVSDQMPSLISECLAQEVTIAIHDMFQHKRNSYETYWPELNGFVKYGVLKDKTFASVMTKRVIFQDIYGTWKTIEEYLGPIPANHKKRVYYASDSLDQAHYISIFRKCNVNALLFDHVIDQPLLYKYETVYPNCQFIRIDSNIEEIYGGLPNEDDNEMIAMAAKKIRAILENHLGNISLSFTRLANESISALIVNDETSRRMADMLEIYGYLNPAANNSQPETKKTLLLNLNNAMVKFILDSTDQLKTDMVARQLFDLAMLSQQALRPEDMEAFINRSEQILSLSI